MDYYPTVLKDKCEYCGSKGGVLSTFVIGLVLMTIVITVLCVLLLKSSAEFEKLKRSMTQQFASGEAQATSVHLLKAKNAFSLVVGYVQVGADAVARHSQLSLLR
ncbi:hypothetical protein CYMTET_20240 [Cymbomonas tetramitiformis]|uniref:Uncharacterized protein n=1 Tax=Cymbomonas tetramitiformis TaxID=36881 RepID=A0AAE0G4G0_9CHLO|nr:hypothetical protein CYMTET_20240 [Cymbomonas tetramitiformis]